MSYVASIRISELLGKLREGEFLIPKFQREFVWSVADVTALISSIIKNRPIGMLTLWEQPDSTALPLEHVSLAGTGPEDQAEPTYFGEEGARTSRYYAVLDGRQRCTAIAVAFGGLKSPDKRKKFAGKFYLDVKTENESDRIIFKKTVDLEKEKIDTLAGAISKGLFPLEFSNEYETLEKQWNKYGRFVRDPKFYPDGKMPSVSEIERRETILDDAFAGINGSTLATYTVPKKYDLGTICEIFETLNQTGTKVSTVDLIHSFLYSFTADDAQEPFLLREWIRELGQIDGAIKWADPDHRPELIAQFVTSCYLAEATPPKQRSIGGDNKPISSVKSGDLLKTPPEHWRTVSGRSQNFANFIGAFQDCVAGKRFPMRMCPYPISAGIYVGLRWANEIDGKDWQLDRINSLYRSFFWRNVFHGRYDQGFLTKMNEDLQLCMRLLSACPDYPSFGSWAEYCSKERDRAVGAVMSEQDIITELLDAKPTGAKQKGLLLPVVCGPRKDILDGEAVIDLVTGDSIELHHIFPQKWIRNNIDNEKISKWEYEGLGGRNCVANFTPMIARSNKVWNDKLPRRALADADVRPETQSAILSSHFISDEAYISLVEKSDPVIFWSQRAKDIAKKIRTYMLVGL
ncbi:MAG: DUF262 domain-containing protein [Oceanicaulis sp.]|nr:DUF262 domain-containing protein [Oceanicaulis sp.]